MPTLPSDQAECLGTLASAWRGAPLTEDAMRDALEHPLWPEGRTGSLFEVVRPGESLGLVVSDQTRKTAVHRVLPILLAGLRARGCRLEDMFVLVATGIHRPPTDEEQRAILGSEVAAAFAGRIFCHDADDEANLVAVGTTPRGHRVRLNRRAVEARRLLLLGAASYHYHAGFGGGRKALVPGLAARATIAHTHSLTLDPDADRLHPHVEIGRLDGNPVAEEMLACAQLRPPDGSVNTVLTPDGDLAGVFAGDLVLAHRAACRCVERMDRIDLERPADFVIASAGTASNWIQSHKALFNAQRAIQPEGRVILQAPCPEGLGNERFRYWLTRPSLEALYRGLREQPEVNGQTALSTRLRGRQAILVTRLNARDTADVGLRTAPDVETAVRLVLEEFRRRGVARPTYYLMPTALALVPFVKRRPP